MRILTLTESYALVVERTVEAGQAAAQRASSFAADTVVPQFGRAYGDAIEARRARRSRRRLAGVVR
jgi:hypothetical protein